MANISLTQSVIAEQNLDYSDILCEMGISYSASDYYWQVGEIELTQGWIVHLSVIRIQVVELLRLVVPLLVGLQFPFKIVRDSDTVKLLLTGSLGYINLGKIIKIYPTNADKATEIVKLLISFTGGFRGPKIPTDRRIAGIVYVRYGSFNPVLRKGPNGDIIKYIYAPNGDLMPDPYAVPFAIPKDVPWPFGGIAERECSKAKKLLNSRYYPLEVIKADAKGDVIRALYFRNFWQIKSCLIKQGRLHMFDDENGRDIQDRLKWQLKLYNELPSTIPVPKVFDYFEENNDAYLAMQFIDGRSLTAWLSSCYNNTCWIHLSLNKRLEIGRIIMNIVTIIQELHKIGIIHRDVTPENFIIDKKGNIYLIDMELAWSVSSQTPNPPFRLGTPGHMSNRQMNLEIPTYKDDIYGLGALMIAVFTNLPAVKFDYQSQRRLKKDLLFFTGDKMISDMIASCLEIEEDKRLELSTVKHILSYYFENNVNGKVGVPKWNDNSIQQHAELGTIIQNSINALGNPEYSVSNGPWHSALQMRETHVGNEQMELANYLGWHTGMAGPLFVVSQAKKIGFNIEESMLSYRNSWLYIKDHYFPNKESYSNGLWYGGAGIAVAIKEGMDAGMLDDSSKMREILLSCFADLSSTLNLANGISGQGLALLKVSNYIAKENLHPLLEAFVSKVICAQEPNGSWNYSSTQSSPNSIFSTFETGTGGITWFLLCCFQYFPTKEIEKSALRALDYLAQKATKFLENTNTGSMINRKANKQDADRFDTPESALPFIKGYQLFKTSIYRDVTTKLLSRISFYPIAVDLTLGTGLAGLGQVYLEAYDALNDEQWRERATWIAQHLIHVCKSFSETEVYWLPLTTTLVTADLFKGNCGIINFLMRYQYPDSVGHPYTAMKSNIDTR